MTKGIKLLNLAIALLFAMATTATANTRNVALVIGNSRYTESISQLENPANDARDVAAAFHDQGYEVVVAIDLGQREMQAKLIDFRAKADAAEIAIVYYAGHGIEIGGQNYVVPVDARLSDQRSASLELIDLNTILAQISGASKLRMLVLDACRNNPFVSKMKRQGNGRNVGRGLSRVIDTQSETLIAFAAAAGEVTPDGEPGGNSPFTAALVKALRGPPVDVRILLGKVRDEMRSTLLGSEPATYGSLGGDIIVINPLHEAKLDPDAEMENGRPADGDALMADFLQADALSTLEAWNVFIDIYRKREDRAIYQLAVRKREKLAQQQEEAAAAEARRLHVAAEAKQAILKKKTERQEASGQPQSNALLDEPKASSVSEFQPDVTTKQLPIPEPAKVELSEAVLAEIKDRAIRDLQVLLKNRNCYHGRVDGLVGAGTRGGIRTLSGLLNVEAELTTSSSAEDFQEVFQKFDSEPDTVCTAVVVKKAPTPRKKTTTRIRESQRSQVGLVPKAVASTPKTDPKGSKVSDYKDDQGNHCDWSNRGNVCE